MRRKIYSREEIMSFPEPLRKGLEEDQLSLLDPPIVLTQREKLDLNFELAQNIMNQLDLELRDPAHIVMVSHVKLLMHAAQLLTKQLRETH